MNRAASNDPATVLTEHEMRLDALLGRQVIGRNGRPVARLEEFRAEIHGRGCVVTHYVLGAAGLAERLGMTVKVFFGWHTGGYLAKWDQLDLSDPAKPKLTCPLEELEKL